MEQEPPGASELEATTDRTEVRRAKVCDAWSAANGGLEHGFACLTPAPAEPVGTMRGTDLREGNFPRVAEEAVPKLTGRATRAIQMIGRLKRTPPQSAYVRGQTLSSFSFAEPRLRRAAWLDHILSNFGEIFAEALVGQVATAATPPSKTAPLSEVTSSGDAAEKGEGDAAAEPFATLSHPTEKLGAFLSHCWRDSRALKTMALLCHFNLSAALGSGILAAVLAGVLQRPLGLPLYQYKYNDWEDDPVDYHYGFAAFVVGNSVFVGVLLFWQRLRGLFRRGGSGRAPHELFLDKVCIRQCHAHAVSQATCPKCRDRQNGLLSLGAFLNASDRLLIMHSEHYFGRLWTAWEFCTFVGLRGGDLQDVDLVPITQPLTFSVGYLCLVLIQIAWIAKGVIFAGSEDAGFLLDLIVMTPACMLLFRQARRWARMAARVRWQIATFDLRKTACSVESDRAIVAKHVSSMAKALKLVGPEASEEEAIDGFNQHLRHHGPRAIMKRLGGGGRSQRIVPVSYRLLLCLNLPCLLFGLDSILPSLPEFANDPSRLVGALLGTIAFFLIEMPLVEQTVLNMAGVAMGPVVEGVGQDDAKAKGAVSRCRRGIVEGLVTVLGSISLPIMMIISLVINRRLRYLSAAPGEPSGWTGRGVQLAAYLLMLLLLAWTMGHLGRREDAAVAAAPVPGKAGEAGEMAVPKVSTSAMGA